MLPDVLPCLRCPFCHAALAAHGDGSARVLCCPAGHSFDVARQGHVDLLGRRSAHDGDTAEMVAARDRFLRAGHFAVISDGVVRAARTQLVAADRFADADRLTRPPGPFVVDAGAGTGNYLAAVLDAVPGGVGLALDIAKAAVRRAARAHPAAAAVRCDTWQALPLADGVADLVLNVFAPRNGAEFARVLRPGGALLMVTPLPDHLGEVVGPLGLLGVDPDKEGRIVAALGDHLVEVSRHPLRRRLRLSHGEVEALVAMGPSARHADPDRLAARLATLPDPVPVTVAVQLTVHRRR
ncbi:putative RNA methyltransferase [Solwaraspora sp. WMMB335]|uniref:putative RNA methyltransferase n=1 Tax=Solwaraspora sp. WMMB335 TaxID=3404118 RepID=UPI003B93EA1A